MDKFGRNYQLAVGTSNKATLNVTLPFTMTLDITKNTLSSANHAIIRVIGLSQYNRSQLRYNIDNYGEYRPIILKAGYGQNIPVVFKGNITQAFSVREVGVGWVTQIEAFDGGFAYQNGQVNLPVIAGQVLSTTFVKLIDQLPNITVGAIGSYTDVNPRGNSYSEPGIDLINRLSGNGFFINDEKAYVLGNSECILGGLAVINTQTGLLDTPVREDTILHFRMLFEPRILMGQKVTLDSKTDPSVNNDYKVISLKHQATISDAVCGDAVTTLGAFYGAGSLKIIPGLSI